MVRWIFRNNLDIIHSYIHKIENFKDAEYFKYVHFVYNVCIQYLQMKLLSLLQY